MYLSIFSLTCYDGPLLVMPRCRGKPPLERFRIALTVAHTTANQQTFMLETSTNEQIIDSETISTRPEFLRHCDNGSPPQAQSSRHPRPHLHATTTAHKLETRTLFPPKNQSHAPRNALQTQPAIHLGSRRRTFNLNPESAITCYGDDSETESKSEPESKTENQGIETCGE